MTKQLTSSQRVFRIVAVPFCLAYFVLLLWPFISAISFLLSASGFNEFIDGFNWNIFLLLLVAYPVGFLLLLG